MIDATLAGEGDAAARAGTDDASLRVETGCALEAAVLPSVVFGLDAACVGATLLRVIDGTPMPGAVDCASVLGAEAGAPVLAMRVGVFGAVTWGAALVAVVGMVVARAKTRRGGAEGKVERPVQPNPASEFCVDAGKVAKLKRLVTIAVALAGVLTLLRRLRLEPERRATLFIAARAALFFVFCAALKWWRVDEVAA